jgi:hypothetical protein
MASRRLNLDKEKKRVTRRRGDAEKRGEAQNSSASGAPPREPTSSCGLLAHVYNDEGGAGGPRFAALWATVPGFAEHWILFRCDNSCGCTAPRQSRGLNLLERFSPSFLFVYFVSFVVPSPSFSSFLRVLRASVVSLTLLPTAVPNLQQPGCRGKRTCRRRSSRDESGRSRRRRGTGRRPDGSCRSRGCCGS